ncbi:hypothetical protein [Massilia sp. BSC265]|uniref:hypothetical protein n=1 Tax=Massilia sp. BSC265 TaxID=1549812 RepID=UPI001269CA72|nr:hypothetical protein [Massilia sp. BSC265]
MDKDLINSVPAKHSRLFRKAPETEGFYKTLYLDQIEVFNLGFAAKRRPGGKICRTCANFHLSTSKNIDKDEDVKVGKKLEDSFEEFFQFVLDKECAGATIERADLENMHNPDFLIKYNKKSIMWMELKVIFRPFINISKKADRSYECYSHSLTLDHGKKLNKQKELVASNNIGENNCIYVYWYDLPCIKGIFWMPSTQVYRHQKSQVDYQRKIVDGDRNKQGGVRGAVNKIYLPLHEMNDFYSILSVIKAKM